MQRVAHRVHEDEEPAATRSHRLGTDVRAARVAVERLPFLQGSPANVVEAAVAGKRGSVEVEEDVADVGGLY